MNELEGQAPANAVSIGAFGRRLLMILLSTAVLVVFSEKVYWYPQGFVFAELVLFYAPPAAACLWAIAAFRVRRPAPLLLVAILYAFLIEGVLTPVLYEGGLLDPIMPAYFAGWHGLLAFFGGWYLLRRWLIAGRWQPVLASSALVGLFWGTWSLTYWLPETFGDFTQPGRWPTVDFALYALYTTFFLAAGHWLLGRGGWEPAFRMGRIEKWLLGAVLTFFFFSLSFPGAPFGFLKLAALIAPIFLLLEVNRRRETSSDLFDALAGPIQARTLLALLPLPVLATAVYAAAAVIDPDPETLRLILELTPLLQGVLGLIALGWGVWGTVVGRG